MSIFALNSSEPTAIRSGAGWVFGKNRLASTPINSVSARIPLDGRDPFFHNHPCNPCIYPKNVTSRQNPGVIGVGQRSFHTQQLL
jgi:hypothetical protein